MPTYVSLIHWTDQGIKNYKDTTSRAADVARLVESAGGRFRELLWTVGEYDAVAVLEFPDEETAVATVLQVGLLASSARTRCGPSVPTKWPPSSGRQAKRGSVTFKAPALNSRVMVRFGRPTTPRVHDRRHRRLPAKPDRSSGAPVVCIQAACHFHARTGGKLRPPAVIYGRRH
jgi:uncharacterized protein with GYD domain